MISWNMITEGYNDLYNVDLTTKEMLESLYREHRNMSVVAEILGVCPYLLRKKMKLYRIQIQPRGHLKPTKLDLFKALPEEELDGLNNKEIAEKIGLSHKTVIYYQYLRRKNYDYGEKNLQSYRRNRDELGNSTGQTT